jgi:putative membrane protein
MSEADHAKVSAAITAAEASTAGEIVAVATPISDSYHDVALHWALVPLFAVLAWAAWRPTALEWWYDFLLGGWQPEPTQSQLFTLLLVFAALKFTVALLILKWMPLRIARMNLPAHISSGGGRSPRFIARSACRGSR